MTRPHCPLPAERDVATVHESIGALAADTRPGDRLPTDQKRLDSDSSHPKLSAGNDLGRPQDVEQRFRSPKAKQDCSSGSVWLALWTRTESEAWRGERFRLIPEQNA